MIGKHASLYMICAVLVVFSCDSQTEESDPGFNINIGQFTEERWNDINADVPRIGQVALPLDVAVDLNRFPHKTIKISSSGYGYGYENDGILTPDLTRSIYLLFLPEDGIPDISDFVSTIPQPLANKTSADSINLEVYAILVERPGIVFPDNITLDFTVDDLPHSLALRANEHVIPLKDQVIDFGKSFGALPEKEGIVVDIISEQFDKSLLPVVLFHRTEVHLSDNRTSLRNTGIVGMAFDSMASAGEFSYRSNGFHQHKILEETEVRAFLLRR